MKVFLTIVMIFLLSCSGLKDVKFVAINNTNEVVPILLKAWEGKKMSFIEKMLGSATKREENKNSIIYSYNDLVVKDFTLLTVEVSKSGDLVSMYYLLSDDNSKIKKDWILNFTNYNWREVKLPITTPHVIVQKIVLLNDEKKIAAGFLDSHKNNQIEYIYFDVEGENYKTKNLFFWE